MQWYMSWHIRSIFGFTFLNILYFSMHFCTNIFHKRSLYTFYAFNEVLSTKNISWHNACHFTYDIFKSIVWNENDYDFITLIFFLKESVNNRPSLIKLVTWPTTCHRRERTLSQLNPCNNLLKIHKNKKPDVPNSCQCAPLDQIAMKCEYKWEYILPSICIWSFLWNDVSVKFAKSLMHVPVF